MKKPDTGNQLPDFMIIDTLIKKINGGSLYPGLFWFLATGFWLLLVTGCTVKTVGDPNRPITINANVVVDIRGLKNTATNIEDMVAQGKQL